MKKTRILSAVLSLLLALTAFPVTAMPLAAAEAPEMGTELLTGGAWSGAEQMDVGYASAKGVGVNFQYYLGGRSTTNRLAVGKYMLSFRARSSSELVNNYLHVEALKASKTNLEYNIDFNANKKLVPGDYTISITLRGKTGTEKFTFQTRNGGKDLPMDDASTSNVETATVMNLTQDWQTFKTTLHFDEMWNNTAYNVWIILINQNAETASFDIADFSFTDASGNEYVINPFKVRGAVDNAYPDNAFVKGSGWTFANKCDTNATKIYTATARTDKLVHAFRNVEMTFTNKNTGVSGKELVLTDDWQTFATEVEIYPDTNTPAGVNTNLCESYTKNGTTWDAWLNFNNRSFEVVDGANKTVGVSYDIADLILVHLPTGNDYLAGAVAQSSATNNTGWQKPNGKINGTTYNIGSYSIKTEKHDAFANGITYTYNTPAELTSGMYSFSADLISAKPTEVEAVAVVADADGEEKTVIINSAEGEKYVTTNALKQKYEFVFTAEEGTKLVSVTLRKTEDTASDAKVRFYSASLKQIGAYGDESFEDELYARLDTEFGAAVVTPDEMGRKYLSVHDRASATDGVKIDTSKLGLDTSKQYTVQFNIRTSVEHTDMSRIHNNNQMSANSQVRIRVNGTGGVTENFGNTWKTVTKSVAGGNVYNIVGGGSAEFTSPFDIDDIVIKDGNTVIWSENFDAIDAGKLAQDFGFKSAGLNGNTGYATLGANKNAGATYSVEESGLYYSKTSNNGLITYSGDKIVLKPGVYTVAGTFRNGAYIATAAEIQWNVGAANGPYTVFENGKIIDHNITTVYAKLDTDDGVFVGHNTAADVSTGWTDYSFSFKVEKETVLNGITFTANHAVDGKNIDLDYKSIALLRRDAHDNGDRPNPGVVMMLLLKMKESGRVKTTKNDYVEVINLLTKGFEYTLWQDAKNPIELGTYTVSMKLRGHTGTEKFTLRIRNEDVELTPENGTASKNVTLTKDFVTYTGTFEVNEESFKNNGKDYHLWITLVNTAGVGASFDVDDLSLVKDGKEFIVDGLKRRDTNHKDSYVKRSGWATNASECTFGIVTEEVSKKTGETVSSDKASRIAVANLVNNKGIEYTVYRDADNTIELGSYTLTLKLRGYTGNEKIRVRFRNSEVTMKNEATGVTASPLALTTEFATFTATVAVPEASFNGNGRDYHVWISLDNYTGSAASFDIGDISLVRNGADYIDDALRCVNDPHDDKYVEKSGWWSSNCSFSRVN